MGDEAGEERGGALEPLGCVRLVMSAKERDEEFYKCVAIMTGVSTVCLGGMLSNAPGQKPLGVTAGAVVGLLLGLSLCGNDNMIRKGRR